LGLKVLRLNDVFDLFGFEVENFQGNRLGCFLSIMSIFDSFDVDPPRPSLFKGRVVPAGRNRVGWEGKKPKLQGPLDRVKGDFSEEIN